MSPVNHTSTGGTWPTGHHTATSAAPGRTGSAGEPVRMPARQDPASKGPLTDREVVTPQMTEPKTCVSSKPPDDADTVRLETSLCERPPQGPPSRSRPQATLPQTLRKPPECAAVTAPPPRRAGPPDRGARGQLLTQQGPRRPGHRENRREPHLSRCVCHPVTPRCGSRD